jgi:divalent metal cation (Fe/Co/Zn/Cd) transporter
MAEALHSATDVLASVMVAFGVTKADKPADLEHPFGHGKIENIGARDAALFNYKHCNTV